jgi:hypothetical protein
MNEKRKIGDWRSWIVDCGLWIVDCGLWIVDCGLWIVDCGLWIVDCGLWIVDWRFRFFVLPLEVLNLHTGRATRPRGADSSGMVRFTAKVAKESEKMRS